jgi:phenylacetic acid degradation operon negative regulatory protein
MVRKKRQLDDPRALGAAAMGAVVFAFGTVGPERERLPGPALVAFLGTLGIVEQAARATILRMRRDGRLRSVRRGPVVEYELTEPSRALSAEVLRPVIGPRPAWDGCFGGLLFSVPERDRNYRDQLRRAAVLAGFGALQPGVLITADERRWARLESILAAAPVGSRLTRVELRMPGSDARAVAADAWPLADLARRYREQTSELLRVADECSARPPEGGAAVRLRWQAMAPVFEIAIEDPGLPDELLPADWPSNAMRDAVIAVATVLMPPVEAFLRTILAA